MPISYTDIVMYLEAIADHGHLEAGNANHDRFWRTMTRDQFVNGTVPGEQCHNGAIPIVNADPAQCPFYQALVKPAVAGGDAGGWCQKSQMPKTGPWITDPGYSVTLSNGTVISGSDISANIVWWLTHGMPA